ncbi:DNA mismatch repair protein Mlh3-like isoform X2 [Diadema setosum]|uniref:DNA mismatch repair protein Mlh3-like isoform X2 n=1 Tax=Diadema setosum TaxID=31175 RepID=UPI003B3AF213
MKMTSECRPQSIHLLCHDVRSRLRSGIATPSLVQCVEELVVNSIDAGAVCIAVRVDIPSYKLQVVDNGRGVAREDLSLLGERYATSKLHDIEGLESISFYGYRGEAIASIRDVASVLEISSRARGCDVTYTKIYHHGKEVGISEDAKARPSAGTTVTAHNMFYNMPVRRKVLNSPLVYERICKRLQAIALIHPSISLTLRDDSCGIKSIQTHSSSSVVNTFGHLFGRELADCLREVNYRNDHFSSSGYIGVKSHRNKSLQFVYVNGRLVLKTKLHKLLNELLNRSLVTKGKGKNSEMERDGGGDDISASCHPSPIGGSGNYGIFVVNITCSHSLYDITMDPTKTLIEFSDWDGVLACVHGFVTSFLEQENMCLKLCTEPLSTESQRDNGENTCTSDLNVGHSAKEYLCNAISTSDCKNTVQSTCVRRQVHAEQDVNCETELSASFGVGEPDDSPATSVTQAAVHSPEMDAPEEVLNMSSDPLITAPTTSQFVDTTSTESALLISPRTDLCATSNSSTVSADTSLCEGTNGDFLESQLDLRKSADLDECLPSTMTMETSSSNVDQEITKLTQQAQSIEAASHCELKSRMSFNEPSSKQGSEVQYSSDSPDINTRNKVKSWNDESRTDCIHSSGTASLVSSALQRHQISVKAKCTLNAFKRSLRENHPANASETKQSLLRHHHVSSGKHHKTISLRSHGSPGFRSRLASLNVKCQQRRSQTNPLTKWINQAAESCVPCDQSPPHPFDNCSKTVDKNNSDSNVYVDSRHETCPSQERALTSIISSTHHSSDSSKLGDAAKKCYRSGVSVNAASTSQRVSEDLLCPVNTKRPKLGSVSENSPTVVPTFEPKSHYKVCSSVESVDHVFRPEIIATVDATKKMANDKAGGNDVLQSKLVHAENTSDREGMRCEGRHPGLMGDPSPEGSSANHLSDSPQRKENRKVGQSLSEQSLPVMAETSSLESSKSSLPMPSNFGMVVEKGCDEVPEPFPGNASYVSMESKEEEPTQQYSSVMRSPSTNVQDPPKILIESDDVSKVQRDVTDNRNATSSQRLSEGLVADRDDEWYAIYEASLGRKVFINRITGNCSLEDPSQESQPAGRDEGVASKSLFTMVTKRDTLAHPHLPHSALPFVSTLKDNREMTTSLDSTCRPLSPVSMATLDAVMDSHQEDDEDLAKVKWGTTATSETWNAPSSVQGDDSQPLQILPEVGVRTSGIDAKFYTSLMTSLNPCQFHKSVFENIEVVGQVDAKFIACLVSSDSQQPGARPHLLVLVDQHAAHERIRLEMLTAECYSGGTDGDSRIIRAASVTPPIPVRLSPSELRLIQAYRGKLGRVGVGFTLPDDGDCVLVTALPECVVEREASETKRGRPTVAVSIVETLIKEELDAIQSQAGARAALPRSITRILNSQACHGAIKFGDVLDLADCRTLIGQLSSCDLPFQCAHGRPAFMPLLDLRKLTHWEGQQASSLEAEKTES